MSDKINTSQNARPVKEYIASIDDEQTVIDSHAFIEMMRRISGHEPKMWNVGSIEFDTYHLNDCTLTSACPVFKY